MAKASVLSSRYDYSVKNIDLVSTMSVFWF